MPLSFTIVAVRFLVVVSESGVKSVKSYLLSLFEDAIATREEDRNSQTEKSWIVYHFRDE